MKKLFTLFLSMAVTLSLALPAWAANTAQSTQARIGYTDYDLTDLAVIESFTATRTASSSKDATVGTVEARLFNNATGTIIGTSPAFKFTGIPTGAKITNIQAWNPSF